MTESLQKNDHYLLVEPGYSQNQRVPIFMVHAYAIHLTSVHGVCNIWNMLTVSSQVVTMCTAKYNV